MPTSENTSMDIDRVKSIYSKIGVTLDITWAAPFDITPYLTNGVLETKDVFGDLTDYSPSQQALINAYKATGKVTNDTYYVFITNAKSSTGQGGYMALGGQFGFVFDQTERTLAHELGHGIFKLAHPFKKKQQGNVPSLMDYTSDENLLFADWKQINDPAFKIGIFQGQSEGELKGGVVIIAGSTDGSSIKFDITKSCKSFFVANKIVSFNDNETEKIKELSISKSGVLQYVTDEKDNKYYPTQYVETKNNEIKARGGIAFLLCTDCIDGVTTVNRSKVYSNIDRKYIIADFTNRGKDCLEGEEILVREGDTYICKTLSKRDCSLNKGLNIGNGNGNGGTIYSLIADEKLSKNLAEKLYSIVARNTTNTITGENHHLNTRILLSHKNILENTAKISVHNENGKDQLYVGNEKVAINPDEIVFWIEYDGSNDKISVKEVVVGDNFDQDLRKTLKQWDEKFQYEQASFFGKLFYIGKDITDFHFTVFYDLFDMLGSGIGKLKIPESVWDCKASNYNPIYAEVFSYLNLSGYVNLITEQIAGEESNLSKAQKEASQANFALFCGMYNGLIDVVKTVPDLGKLLYSFGSSKGRANNSKFVQQLENIEVTDDNGNVIYGKGLGFGKLWFLFKEGISDQFSKDNPCKKNEFIGSIAGPIIVLCFGDVAASESVLAKIGSTSLKALQFCDRIADPFRYMGISIRYIKNASGKLLIVFRNATGKVAERLESGLYRVRVLVNNTERLEDVSEDVAEELFNGRTAPIGGDTNARLAHTAEDTAEKVTKELLEKAESLVKKARSEASKFANDSKVINKVAEFLSNKKALEAIGGEEGLEAIIRANVRAGCSTCGKATTSFLKNMDEYLDDVLDFVSKYKEVDGFDDVIRELKKLNKDNSPNYAVEGAAFMLGKMRKTSEITPQSVKRFDARFESKEIDCSNCRFDIELFQKNVGDLKYLEYKSYIDASKISLNQFQSYLQSVNTLGELRYVFDISKISASKIKGGIKKFFTNNEDEIFKTIWKNKNLRDNLFNTSNYPKNISQNKLKELMKEDFHQLISKQESQLYKIIKVE